MRNKLLLGASVLLLLAVLVTVGMYQGVLPRPGPGPAVPTCPPQQHSCLIPMGP